MSWFYSLGVVMQALIAGLFTWFMTLLGAGSVFIFKNPSRKLLDMMLGFAAGVMIAASFWSLLAPSIDMAERMGMIPWVPAVVGFLLGAVVLRIMDLVLPHLHPGEPIEHAEGIHTTWKKTVLLVAAITLHNIPEGLAVGVAFGAIGAGIPSAGVAGAIALAIGIGIQNFPEGLAVSAPLRREGMSVGASFFWGQMSAMVEPVFAVIGAALVMVMQPVLPYALAFAAGAMIFVVIEDVIPESQLSGNSDISTHGAIVGFAVMMLLDVALG
ncbi:ZIP family metal transporter [Spirochaetia bacterium 38H-sp]|uniref:ZIP family metal transporter n=1 Tax=Rarispira pelagica TaxID=3141764 RepID=A0ABU9UCB2_9SPIR